jgi:hypothetical protein
MDSSASAWRTAHAAFFLVGGLAFVLGTAYLYVPNYALSSVLSGWLYVVGSLGFLAVDVLEFFTFIDIRTNIALSICGSTLYVIGSIGFVPVVYAVSPLFGIWGFIAGSLFIAVSECWKMYRIGCLAPEKQPLLSAVGDGSIHANTPQFACRNFWRDANQWTAFGTECFAFLGAFFFLVGTLLFQQLTDSTGPAYTWVVHLWEIGSCAFTVGAAHLTYRHTVLQLT